MSKNYFPQGIAKGEAFLGRSHERDLLLGNIKASHHTLILAPRRYGKTSLVVNTLAALKLPYAEVNLYLAVTPKAIEKKILKAVSTILSQLVSKPEQLLKGLQQFFMQTRKTWTFGFKGILGLELVPDSADDIPGNILTSLLLVEDALARKKKKAVLFIDEVQELENIEGGFALEGAIREFAQQAKHLVLIFSGSNRRMLLHMFDDRSMPLYELCDRVQLTRLPDAVYKKYLNKVAKKTWGEKLTDAAIEKVLTITENHPRRLYNLCHHLWLSNQTKVPTAAKVTQAWQALLEVRIRDIRSMLGKLAAGQLKVLGLIASGMHTGLSGKEAQLKTNMTGPSLINSVQQLEEHDYIEKTTDHHYRILDPLVRDIIVIYELDSLL